MPVITLTEEKKEPNIFQLTCNGLTWVYIERPTGREAEFLARNYPFFHPLNLEDIQSRIQLPKIDDYKDHLFIVLHFPVFNRESRMTTPSEVDFFIGENFVVTVHCAGDLRPLARLFKECQVSQGSCLEYLGRGSGHLLYRIIDTLVDSCFPMLNKIIDNVDKAEDRVLGRPVPEMVHEVMVIRRDLLSFRHIIRLEIPVIESLEEKERRFFPRGELEVYFGDIRDHLNKIWNTLEEYKEVVEVITDTSNWLTSHRIQEVMRILTVVMAIMMPINVIAGIYGMNVWLPLGTEPRGSFLGIVVIVGLIFLIVGAMLFFFRRRHWI